MSLQVYTPVWTDGLGLKIKTCVCEESILLVNLFLELYLVFFTVHLQKDLQNALRNTMHISVLTASSLECVTPNFSSSCYIKWQILIKNLP